MRAGAASIEWPTGQPITLPGWKLRKSLSGFGWSALSVTVLTGWFVVTRFSVTHDLRIWDVMALRSGGGALILLPVLFRRAPRLPGRAWLEGLLFAALWGAPFVFFVALGLQLTSAEQASAVTPALMPVFAGLIGWLSLREPPGGLRLVAYVIIVGGLAALAIGNELSDGRRRYHCLSPRDRRGIGRSRSREIPSGFDTAAVGATIVVGELLTACPASSQKHSRVRLSAGELS